MKWGLRWELCIIIVFIICLLVATIGLNRFGLLSNDAEGYIMYTGEEEGDSFSYVGLENKVAQAGSKYYKSHYPNGLNSNVAINVDKLYNSGYLSTLRDGKNRKCTGYAILTKSGSSFGYIKCPRYKTEGYDGSYE